MELLTNLILVFSILFNWLTSFLPDSRQQEPAAAAVSQNFVMPTPERALPTRFLSRDGTHWTEMEYVHYDPDIFLEQIDRLYALEQDEDLAAVLALYDELYGEFSYINTLGTIAGIRYSMDVTDSYWAEETLYCSDLWSETGDSLSRVCRHILDGPLGEEFTAHIGPEAAEAIAAYEPMSDREWELAMEEAERINEYFEVINTAYEEAVYFYRDSQWTWEKMSGIAGDTLYAKDYEGYLEVYYGLDKWVNEQVGPLFLELLQIRAEIAQLAGYDSYADYAYEYTYGRDFTTGDAQLLCDSVKELAAEYYNDLYYSDLRHAYGDVYPQMDGPELIAALGEHLAPFGEELQQAWAFMDEHGLCVLSSSPDAQAGAYTTELTYYRSPFIFQAMAGDCYDFSTLTHEFGHFADAYYNPTPNLLTSVGSYDLFEIHSTGLEVLFTEVYDQVYTEGADTAAFITLAGQLENIFDGCIMDEFQRRLYENPDMTLSEINRLYRDISAEYGVYEPMEVNYSWVYVSHNYESPLYYISYAVSSLASLQLWDICQTDPEAAVDAYLAILAQGAYDRGYTEVLTEAGLRLFTQQGAMEDICRPVLDRLRALDRAH